MQAVLVSPGAAPSFVDIPVSQPGPGEMLVQIAAAGVNPVDGFTAAGGPREAGWAPSDAVLGLGWDLAGEVVATGDGASVLVGARVAAIVADSTTPTFSEFVTVPESDVAVIPDGMATTDAAALPLVTLTAAQALDLAGTPPGELLITGAAGAVGAHAVVLAARAGWTVTGLARDADRAFVLGAGAATATVEVDGEYDAVLDAANLGDAAVAAVRDGGRYVGVIPGANPTTERIVSTAVQTVPDGARLAELLGLAAQGVLAPRVRAIVPLARFDAALEEAARSGARGKVVVTVD